MDLTGKKLLMMGGSAYFEHIKQYAEKEGFVIIAVGNNPNAKYYVGADKAFPYSTMDTDRIIDLVKREKIDGIFVGAQEMNIPPAIKVAEETGIHFYAEREQWEVLSDKARFKKLCIECGVPVVPEYTVKTEEDIATLPFPVLIKPVDGSGGHGMNACYSKESFNSLRDIALQFSQKKEIIVEKLITDADEVFFQYTVQNGKCSLASAFTKVFTVSENKSRILPIFHMYPSNHLDDCDTSFQQSIQDLVTSMHVRNGVLTIQSFYKDGRFYVFEAGFRMGGAQNYIFTEYQNGTNSLHYMINYALTGEMCDYDIPSKDNARFRHPCCNYYVGLKPGTIKSMPKTSDIIKLPGVLNVTRMRDEGDVIEDTNALDRICLRFHVVGKTKSELADNLVNICRSLNVLSTDGEDMLLEHLDHERCMQAIARSIARD